MGLLAFTNAQLKRDDRPQPEYELDLRGCAVKISESGIVVDTTRECWKSLWKKYGGSKVEGVVQVELAKDYVRPANRPPITFKQVQSLATAALTGKYVSLEVVTERVEICKKCDRLGRQGPVDFCTMCGCPIALKDKAIMNLTSYEENLPHWGCKHPERAAGKGWKR